ncbi:MULTISPECIES: hypothetical protein [Luteimonas]|uniref:PIN domain-containing protein n=1 Tax=Luteimonas chenhongjianii TaxID=2006110 RepID=A0A290XGH4_9GAMM|nr:MULTISPECIES: hypothetical protein [Luteimonas]ATD68255.1 hypothetical protein CNR27_13125 [Luteimonas chenhongjianii]RPD88068.1 hypothetical protein EGK76_02485 [Luteimonas sp. 100069]
MATRETTALLDVSLLRWMTQSTRVKTAHTIESEGRAQKFHVAQVLPREMPKGWKAEEVAILPELCMLERSGWLALFKSAELLSEEMRGWQVGQGLAGDLLSKIRFRYVPSPIERSRLMSLPSNTYNSKECQTDFFKMLLEANRRGDLQNLRRWPLTKFELQSVEEFGRFAEICSCLTESQYVDAWHLWTAERSGIDFFLTLDKRFVNAMTRTSRVSLLSRPIYPSDLVAIARCDDHDLLDMKSKE